MRFALLTIALLAAAGCGREEEVRHYRAPKDPMWRMIGAVVRTPSDTWFFKVTSPADRLETAKAEVLGFLRKLRIEDGQVRWTVPQGWTEEKGGAQRESTLRFGDHEPKFEVTVNRFPGDAGGLAANVNRWRDQLGLEKVDEATVTAQAKKLDNAAAEVHVVDLIGPTRPAGPRGGMQQQQRAEPPPQANRQPTLEDIRAMFTFDRPTGWKENPRPSVQDRLFEFAIDSDGGQALVGLSLMGGGGTLASNVNRWRGQAGLEPLPEADVAKVCAPMSFVGNEAWLVEAIGAQRGIVVVASFTPEFSLFFKMDGTPSTVQAQKATFMKVAQSFVMKGRHE